MGISNTRELASSISLNSSDQSKTHQSKIAKNVKITDFAKVINTPNEDEIIVDIYDTGYTLTTMKKSYTEPSTQSVTVDNQVATIVTEDDNMFSMGDTINVQGVQGYESDGITVSNRELILWVESCDATNGLRVRAVNGKKIGNVENCVPAITRGAVLTLMGKALLHPTDVIDNTDIGTVRHVSSCFQNFKIQTSKSDAEDISVTLKQAEDIAVSRMKELQERNYLFGVGPGVPMTEPIPTADGIWGYAGSNFVYDDDGFEEAYGKSTLLSITKEAFAYASNNSKPLYLFGGAELIYGIQKANNGNIIENCFGKIIVYYYPTFDSIGFDGCGIVLDPDGLKKYVKAPLTRTQVEDIENDDIIVSYTESSCLIYDKHPKTIMRITKV